MKSHRKEEKENRWQRPGSKDMCLLLPLLCLLAGASKHGTGNFPILLRPGFNLLCCLTAYVDGPRGRMNMAVRNVCGFAPLLWIGVGQSCGSAFPAVSLCSARIPSIYRKTSTFVCPLKGAQSKLCSFQFQRHIIPHHAISCTLRYTALRYSYKRRGEPVLPTSI